MWSQGNTPACPPPWGRLGPFSLLRVINLKDFIHHWKDPPEGSTQIGCRKWKVVQETKVSKLRMLKSHISKLGVKHKQ